MLSVSIMVFLAMQAQAMNTQVSIAPVQNRPPSVDPSGNSPSIISQAATQVWPEQVSALITHTNMINGMAASFSHSMYYFLN